MLKKSLAIILVLLLIYSQTLSGTFQSVRASAFNNVSSNTPLGKSSSAKLIDNPEYAQPENGFINWVYQTNSPSSSTPVICPDGTVYFSAGNTLYAINQMGEKLWSWQCDVSASYLNSPKLGRNGRIYVTSGKGALYTFDKNGKNIWSYIPGNTTDNCCLGCTICENDTIYYINSFSTYSVLYAVNENGILMWFNKINQEARIISPPVVNNSLIFVSYSFQNYYNGGRNISRKNYIDTL